MSVHGSDLRSLKMIKNTLSVLDQLDQPSIMSKYLVHFSSFSHVSDS